MSNRTTRVASAQRQRARPQSPVSSAAADNPDHALANIRAWTQLLVARGNRLLELAVREREAVADHRDDQQPAARKRRDPAQAHGR